MRIPHWAHRGTEVACIKSPADSSAGTWGDPHLPGDPFPELGKTYVIADVEVYRRKVFLTLVGFPSCLLWDIGYFAPIQKVTSEADLALFRDIARRAPAEQLTFFPADEVDA